MTTKKRAGTIGLVLLATLAVALPAAAQEAEASYEAATRGTRWLESPRPGGPLLKVLVESANLGGDEMALAEITFSADAEPATRPHRHGSLEVFYVLEGTLGHEVDGERHELEPGMVGIVRPGDDVVHTVLSPGDVKALVIWVPADEVERIAPSMEERPVGGRGGG